MPDLALSDSINELNLFGLSRLVNEPDVSPRQLIYPCLRQRAVAPLPAQTRDAIGDIIVASHEWSCKTPTLLGRVLQSRSRPPADLEHALHLLHLDTRSARWTQSFQPLMPADDPELGHQQRQLIELEDQRSRFLCRLHVQPLA